MTHHKSTVNGQEKTSAEEQKQLQQEDIRWLGELEEMLSPYWSARLTYGAGGQYPLLVIDGLQKKDWN